jgi:hypothetical protein
VEYLEDRLQPGNTFFGGFWGFGFLGLAASLRDQAAEWASGERRREGRDLALGLEDSAGSADLLGIDQELWSESHGTARGEDVCASALPQVRSIDRAEAMTVEDFLGREPGRQFLTRPMIAAPIAHAELGANAPSGTELEGRWNGFTPQSQTFTVGPAGQENNAHLNLVSVPQAELTSASGNLFFDLSTGQLNIRGEKGENTVRETMTPAGFVEVMIGNQQHSSDPSAADYDGNLAGATERTMTAIRYVSSGGHDTLSLGSVSTAGSFMVSAPGAEIVAQDIGVGGQLGIEADRITVGGALYGREIGLLATGLISVETAGGLVARDGDNGGRIDVNADIFVTTGQLHADGVDAGQVFVHARNISNAGQITADGNQGVVGIVFTSSYIDTTAALNAANGGHLTITGGSTGRLYSSGKHQAMGIVGGTIDLLGREVVLNGATVDASGETGGGVVRIGGDLHGRTVGQVTNLPGLERQVENLPHSNAQTVTVTGAATIEANAVQSGDGGRVVVWAEQASTMDGAVSARGGRNGGDGGFIELSGKASLNYSGAADAGARLGKRGTLLLDPKNIIISSAPVGVFPQFNLIDPHPTPGTGQFGTGVTVLSTGKIVVINPADNFGGPLAGAVYLFDGPTGVLVSSLLGANPNDLVGYSGVTPLDSGNYLIRSPVWNSNRGAVTWGSGTTGVAGIVSDANSLVGSNSNEFVGNVVTLLNNGNYLVLIPAWNSSRGAATWGDGTRGISGPVSDTNSLVGSNPNDLVGSDFTLLTNGNYVVRSRLWNGLRGAVTWGDGRTGVHGIVSEANSLVGTNPYDFAGDIVTPLNNGNYLIRSQNWNAQRGAVTWGDGRTGVRGIVSDTNSLVGSNLFDSVGIVIPLSNDNYVVCSPNWNGQRGAATWGDGHTGVRGAVSDANSLVGTNLNDSVCINGITPLNNGNYVVRNPGWNNNHGAATWGDGSAGVRGAVSEANSLAGSNPSDRVGNLITPLSNGNYVVQSPAWNSNRGAATWGDGSTGVRGAVSEANSLTGSNANDRVGSLITPLSNGNYVVQSPAWNSNRGAATWGDGQRGARGAISETNSLIGSNSNDGTNSSSIPLSNGNYVVKFPSWNNNRGAVTWGSGTSGVSGTIDATNSLVGPNPNDILFIDIYQLSNGNYLIDNPYSNGFRGAVTWADGITGVRGTISEANSLVGSNRDDLVGVDGIVSLSNGNYVVRSSHWNGERGAVTCGDGGTGVSGIVSAANSLIGSNPNDLVGHFSVTSLSNGNYVVRSSEWNGNRGAVTWGDGGTGVSGIVSVANSLVGSNPNDYVGDFGVTPLNNGNYLVHSPEWHAHRGAVTFVDGTGGRTLDGDGVITPQNSIVGQTADAGLRYVAPDSASQSFLAPFVTEGSGRVAVGLVDPNQFNYTRAQSQTITLTPDFLTGTLNTGTDVVLEASNDITVEDPITVNAGGKGGALTLQAGRSIILNASISSDNGPLTLIANDTLANGVVDLQRDPGNAFITMAGRTELNTSTGPLNIELRNGAGRTYTSSRSINLQTINAGSVNVVNNGPSSGSDVILGPVTSNGQQTYSSRNGTTFVSGNLTAADNPITFTDSVVVDERLRIDPGADSIRFNSTGTQNLQTGSGDSFGNVEHNGTGTLQLGGPLNISGSFTNTAGIFDANNQPVTVSGLATLTAGTYRAGTAPQNFLGGLVVSGGTFTSSMGPMSVNGPVAITGGSLAGEGTVGPVTVIAGTLSPGAAGAGILTVDGSVALFSGSMFTVRLNGLEPGTSYSQLVAEGPVFLGGSTLNLVLGFEPPVGSSFEIVQNSGPDPISGTFAGLDEGAVFAQGGFEFQIMYMGGNTGNSVVLTRVK